MTMRFQPKQAFAILGLLTALAAPTAAVAQPDSLLLSCENGRNYPIHPIAVSIAGELVTGYIQTGPRQRLHIRLIPMGNGYRYAAHGLWFDGFRGAAVLNYGPSHAVACSVS